MDTKEVESLIKKADSGIAAAADAMKYSQAALSAAHALAIISNLRESTTNKGD